LIFNKVKPKMDMPGRAAKAVNRSAVNGDPSGAYVVGAKKSTRICVRSGNGKSGKFGTRQVLQKEKQGQVRNGRTAQEKDHGMVKNYSVLSTRCSRGRE